MESVPDNWGVGLSHTVFNPAVLAVVLISGFVICFASRNKALSIFLAASILIPTDQVLVVGPFHFPALRILILFGMARMLWAKIFSQSRIFSLGLNGIDKALILLSTFTFIDGVLLWRTSEQLIYQLGNIYTAFGLYFLLRFLIRDEEDIRGAIRTLAYIAAAVAVLMTYEQATGRNPVYSLLGGARAGVYGTVVAGENDHRFRATGSFAHPILAGTFGAILMPVFVGLGWKYKKDRKIALLGTVAAIVIPIAANSSTCLLGLIGGLGALCIWPLRKVMRPIRWSIVIVLVALHLVMKSPVWHLIARIDLTGSSSSYHRYELVNQCIRHFSDWFLVGTKDYASWDYSMYDLGNQYVAVADTVGLIPLVCFLAVVVFGFKYLGKARRASEANRGQELFIWAMGAALFANVIAFFGISYFDQTVVVWYAHLAIISTLAALVTPAVIPVGLDSPRPLWAGGAMGSGLTPTLPQAKYSRQTSSWASLEADSHELPKRV